MREVPCRRLALRLGCILLIGNFVFLLSVSGQADYFFPLLKWEVPRSYFFYLLYSGNYFLNLLLSCLLLCFLDVRVVFVLASFFCLRQGIRLTIFFQSSSLLLNTLEDSFVVSFDSFHLGHFLPPPLHFLSPHHCIHAPPTHITKQTYMRTHIRTRTCAHTHTRT